MAFESTFITLSARLAQETTLASSDLVPDNGLRNLHVFHIYYIIWKMPSLLADFSHAVRGLRKSPALAAVAIASLALGIGTNVTVFSVVREMILDDLSARRPERLVRVEG